MIGAEYVVPAIGLIQTAVLCGIFSRLGNLSARVDNLERKAEEVRHELVD